MLPLPSGHCAHLRSRTAFSSQTYYSIGRIPLPPEPIVGCCRCLVRSRRVCNLFKCLYVIESGKENHIIKEIQRALRLASPYLFFFGTHNSNTFALLITLFVRTLADL